MARWVRKQPRRSEHPRAKKRVFQEGRNNELCQTLLAGWNQDPQSRESEGLGSVLETVPQISPKMPYTEASSVVTMNL